MADAITRGELSKAGLDWLLDSTFLCQLSPADQDQLLALSSFRSFAPGELIVPDGQPAPGVELIVEGQATVLRRDPKGELSPQARIAPGLLVGERSVLLGEPTNAEVRALSPVRSLHLAPADFRILLDRLPQLRAFVENLVALRDQTPPIQDLLLRTSFFRLLSREDVEQFVQSGSLEKVAAGQLLVTAGDRATEVYLLLRGRVAVYAPSKPRAGAGAPAEPQRRELLATEGPGWMFGHAAALLDLPRTADVEALEPCELLSVPAKAFMEIVSQNPSLQRRLYQELARMDLRATDAAGQARALLVSVYGARPGVGTTSLAYALAAELSHRGPTLLLDLAGPDTARRLGLPARDGEEGGVPVQELAAPESWTVRVLWPKRREDTLRLLEVLRIRASDRGHVVVSALAREQLDVAAMSACEAVAFVRPAADATRAEASRHGQYRIEAIRLPERGGPDLSLSAGPNSVRVPPDRATVERFWRTRDLEGLRDERTGFGRAARRLARVLLGRSVGLALGGGGALGYAHVGLIRVLSAAGIPIDYIAGSSFGALVGGVYAVAGLPGLDELVKRRSQMLKIAVGGMVRSQLIQWYFNHVWGHQFMSATEVPFFPVSMDLHTGKEVILPRGSVAEGVRASSSLPGAYPAWHFGSWRLVDGGIVNNVPASVIWEAGAHFIVASNIIPSTPAAIGSPRPRGFAALLQTGGLRRVDDLMRSMYLMMSQIGRDRSTLADYVFDLDIAGYNIYDFPDGEAIAAAGQRQAERELPAIQMAWKNDNSARIGTRASE